MCKKCGKHHHTLLHKEADSKLGKAKEPSKAACAAPSRQSEEVLLMTCRVKVIAPDGSITQARALLDCAASTSLITERLAQRLRLPRLRSPRQPSNFTIKGVAGYDIHP